MWNDALAISFSRKAVETTEEVKKPEPAPVEKEPANVDLPNIPDVTSALLCCSWVAGFILENISGSLKNSVSV